MADEVRLGDKSKELQSTIDYATAAAAKEGFDNRSSNNSGILWITLTFLPWSWAIYGKIVKELKPSADFYNL